MKTTRLLTALFIFCATLSLATADASVKTILLWPGTPPGAKDADAEKAQAMATAINSTKDEYIESMLKWIKEVTAK